MRQEDLLDAIGSVKEERLARTEKKVSSSNTWIRIGSVAACLIICVIAATALPSLSYKSTDGFPGASADSTDSLTIKDYNPQSPESLYQESGLENEPAGNMTSFGDGAYESLNNTMEQFTAEQDISSQEESKLSARKLITTMHLSIEAENYDDVISWIEQQTASLGGYVQSADSYTRYNDLHYASYTLRIPAGSLSAFTEGVGSIGNITSSSSETQDITLSYTDVQSHIQSLKIEQQRLMELLEQAESLSDMLDIEDRLSYVRYELESYESRLLLYDNQVTYSTLYLEVSEVTAYTEPEPVTFGQRVQNGFSRNLTALSDTATNLLVFLLSSLPTILVIATIAGIAVFLFCKVWKQRRR